MDSYTHIRNPFSFLLCITFIQILIFTNGLAQPCDPLPINSNQIIEVSSIDQLHRVVNQANETGGNKTILLADGHYKLEYPLNITASNMSICSKSRDRKKVIITGDGMNGNISHIFLIAESNIMIADISFGEVANHAIQIHGELGVQDILVHNVRIFNTGEQMIKGSFNKSARLRSSNCIIECSLLEYTSDFGPQYYIGGIDVHFGKDWIVRNNTFKNIRSPDPSSIAEHAIHFWSSSEDTIVEKNLIINCDRGIGFGLGDQGHIRGIIRNNMITNNGKGVHNDVGIGLENSLGTKVFHNSIFMTSKYPNAIEYRFKGSKNIKIFNNLTNKAIKSRDGAKGVSKGNYSRAKANWFVNSKNNLHLAKNISAIVDKGLRLDQALNDYDGTQRPFGKGFDIGADEIKK